MAAGFRGLSFEEFCTEGCGFDCGVIDGLVLELGGGTVSGYYSYEEESVEMEKQTISLTLDHNRSLEQQLQSYR